MPNRGGGLGPYEKKMKVRDEQRKRNEKAHAARVSRTAFGNEKKLTEQAKQIADLQKQLKAQKPAQPQPKPAGPQQIEPVQHSPEVNHARGVVDKFQAGLKDNKSPWAQAQADAASSANFGNFNLGGKTSSSQPQKDPQAFADKYKLDLIGSGATKKASEPSDTPMTAQQILAQDKQQGWS